MIDGIRIFTARQNKLVDYLLKNDRTVTVSEIARILECGERTIRRDVEKLTDVGVEIERVPGRTGGLVERFQIDLVLRCDLDESQVERLRDISTRCR